MQPGNNASSGNALRRKTLLGDRYKIWQTIGEGGFGITYRAYDEIEGVEVVIKENLPADCARWDPPTLRVVPLGGPDDKVYFEKAKQHFFREAKVLASLNHPNIVRVTHAFRGVGTAFYVMPWVGGQDLRSFIQNQGKPREAYFKYVLTSLLDALDYIHRRQLLHRDIKPSNILCTDQGVPILIDFGAVRRLDSDRTQTVMGTPHYLPIEQIRSHGNMGAWTDLYALGATMYVLLTGSKPPACLDRIGGRDPYVPLVSHPLLKSGRQFSKSFLQSIDKALRVQPEDRWQSAREWLEELGDDSSGDEGTVAIAPQRPYDPRKGWWIVALSVAVLIIVILLIIIYRIS